METGAFLEITYPLLRTQEENKANSHGLEVGVGIPLVEANVNESGLCIYQLLRI